MKPTEGGDGHEEYNLGGEQSDQIEEEADQKYSTLKKDSGFKKIER